ncbi:MAG TPA: ATP-binding cassette domain-containing protein, partial [Bacillota bacterium]|nr:ATP-binding cassette domain-containing protein [Bacillota bacterium]
LNSIRKTFRVAERPPGLFGAIRGAFVREYKEIKALDGISFTIDEGELVGYIGPNGAGKSTTVKIMSGILVPESGQCEIMGRIPWKNRTEHVAAIGVVFGQRSQLWWDLPVYDSFHLLRDIYNVPEKEYQRRIADLTDILFLNDLLNTPVRQLSLGQRMRCELAASLLHQPRILFLDEPTIGLDAVSKLGLRDFLKEMNQKLGVTMILTTHDMDDIESLCERVMVIGHGRLLYDGQLEGLKLKYAPERRIRAKLTGWPSPAATPPLELPGADRIEIKGADCLVYFQPQRIQAHQLVAALAAAYPVTDLTVEEQELDQMIARMYQELKL